MTFYTRYAASNFSRFCKTILYEEHSSYDTFSCLEQLSSLEIVDKSF